MQANHPWYWGITECQQGPDYYFLATFAPQDSPQLAALVQRYLPRHFVRNKANTAAIQYLDDSTYRKLQVLQQGEDVRIWFSATIEVLGPELSICHQLGGGQDYAEASLIRALA